MKYTEVLSTAISRVGYDRESSTMEVVFCSGGTARHEAVTPEEHDAFLKSESIGKAYATMFRKSKAGVLPEKTMKIKK